MICASTNSFSHSICTTADYYSCKWKRYNSLESWGLLCRKSRFWRGNSQMTKNRQADPTRLLPACQHLAVVCKHKSTDPSATSSKRSLNSFACLHPSTPGPQLPSLDYCCCQWIPKPVPKVLLQTQEGLMQTRAALPCGWCSGPFHFREHSCLIITGSVLKGYLSHGAGLLDCF